LRIVGERKKLGPFQPNWVAKPWLTHCRSQNLRNIGSM